MTEIQMKKLLSYPPLSPLKHPFNFNTPMSRVDFWLFYVAYIFLSTVPITIFEVMGTLLTSGTSIEMVTEIALTVFCLLWLGYLFLAMISATGRRMRDSGYSLIGLVLSLVLGFATFTTMTLDILAAFREATILPAQEGPIPFSEHTLWCAMATIISLVYVFLGTIRPSKPVPEDPENPDAEA